MPIRRHELARGEVQAWNNARKVDDPRRLDAPAMAAQHALHDRFRQRGRRGGVTEYAVRDARGQRLENCRRRAEVTVRHPKGDGVAPGVAFPARAPGAGSLYRGIEVELHDFL
jgi:hypothetical protein